MTDAFSQGGSQDVQRNPQGGIPEGSVVPAFVSSASYHLGSVTRQAGLPREWAEIGGGLKNLENRFIKQPWTTFSARTTNGTQLIQVDLTFFRRITTAISRRASPTRARQTPERLETIISATIRGLNIAQARSAMATASATGDFLSLASIPRIPRARCRRCRPTASRRRDWFG